MTAGTETRVRGGAAVLTGTNRRAAGALRSIRALSHLPALLARPSYALASLACGVPVALVVGLPTAIVPSGVFVRMTPVRPLDWVLWLASAALAGALQTRLSAGGLLSVLAVGCPTCNKLAVLALGAGGALTFFAPLQPLLGAVSLVLLAHALGTRLTVLGVTGSPAPRRLAVPTGLARV